MVSKHATIEELLASPFGMVDLDGSIFIQLEGDEIPEDIRDNLYDLVCSHDYSESEDAVQGISDIILTITADTFDICFNVDATQTTYPHYYRGDYNNPPEYDADVEDEDAYFDMEYYIPIHSDTTLLEAYTMWCHDANDDIGFDKAMDELTRDIEEE